MWQWSEWLHRLLIEKLRKKIALVRSLDMYVWVDMSMCGRINGLYLRLPFPSVCVRLQSTVSPEAEPRFDAANHLRPHLLFICASLPWRPINGCHSYLVSELLAIIRLSVQLSPRLISVSAISWLLLFFFPPSGSEYFQVRSSWRFGV